MKVIETKTDLSGLNKKQLEAVLSDDKRLLVLAGAGSGKTKTLIQKLEYLKKDKQVRTSEILAITFTKNATNEMIDRLIAAADTTDEYSNLLDSRRSAKQIISDRKAFLEKYPWVNRVSISTFHSLCFKIMKSYGSKGAEEGFIDNKFRLLLDESSKDEELNTLTASMTRADALGTILIQCCEDRNFLIDFKKYLLDYLVDRIDIKKSKNGKKYTKEYTCLNGTKVRSKSEQYIADWLYRHNINFQYEPKVNMKKFTFKPDFFIPDANLYLEHVSNLSAPMDSKEKELFEAGKVLVKTYESQTNDTAYFNLILEKAIKGRLPLDYSTESNLNYEEEFKHYHKEVNSFRRQILTVMDMIKVENLDYKEIFEKGKKNQHERVRKFYEFAERLITEYNAFCVNKSYRDFNDLILGAVSLLENNPSVRQHYQDKFNYIMVDEFQDVNNLQVKLLALLVTNDTQLFCVGDDWQSIYGFRGSNVDYIVNFEKYYPNAKIIKLNTNYRSTPNIVGASNEIIKHNKNKVEKIVEAFKKSNSAIHVYEGETEDDNINYVIRQIEKLKAQGYSKEDILFLYRRSKMFAQYFEAFKRNGIFVSAKTIHASKGLEAKAVFILGLTEGNGGFPDVWLTDSIYQVIKGADESALLEEERRLFYVAVTRAKDHLYLVSLKDSRSRFIDEIPRKFTVESVAESESFILLQCPECKNPLKLSDNFCSDCGQVLTNKKTEKPSPITRLNSENLEQLVLECVRDLKFEVGANYLANILIGSEKVLNRGNQPADFTNYGELKDHSHNQVKNIIVELIKSGKLATYKGTFGNEKVCLP